jgi:transcriptional regulator with XRE-family HTH domain
VDLRRHFGQNLARQRHIAGLSQERLASRAHLDRTAISLLENGKRMPRLDTIVALTRALDLESPEALLDGAMAFAPTPPDA